MSKIEPLEVDSAAQVAACWSCRGPVAGRVPFCPTCGAVQPPGAADAFTRLGLSRQFEVDVAALDARYFDLQRRLHPDRFATRTARERAFSQQQAVALNEAYETLRDPLRRAALLLRLAGREVRFDGQGTIADAELLMDAMERRERLDGAEGAEAVAAILAETKADIRACAGELANAFAARDLALAERLATRLRYLGKLADEARARQSA